MHIAYRRHRRPFAANCFCTNSDSEDSKERLLEEKFSVWIMAIAKSIVKEHSEGAWWKSIVPGCWRRPQRCNTLTQGPGERLDCILDCILYWSVSLTENSLEFALSPLKSSAAQRPPTGVGDCTRRLHQETTAFSSRFFASILSRHITAHQQTASYCERNLVSNHRLLPETRLRPAVQTQFNFLFLLFLNSL